MFGAVQIHAAIRTTFSLVGSNLHSSTIEAIMNKDQAKGAAKNLGGKLQEQVGKLVGSKHQQEEGVRHQVVGRMQEAVGDMKQAVKNIKSHNREAK
jgi:uncharacterized protein YjbJ (UPF0337 family)